MAVLDLSLQLDQVRSVIRGLTPAVEPSLSFVLAPDDRPLSQMAPLNERMFEVDSPSSGGTTQNVYGPDAEQAQAQILVTVWYDAKRSWNTLRDKMASDRDLLRTALQDSGNYARNVQIMTYRSASDVKEGEEFIRRTLVFDCLYLATVQ